MPSKEILDVLILDNQDRCAALWVYRTADETPANWTLVTPDNGYLAMTPTGVLYAFTNGAWVDQGAGAHPNLATHDALGLATDAEVSTHASDGTSVHGITDTAALVVTTDSRLSDARTPTSHGDASHAALTYEASGAVSTHAGAADPHTGYQKESEKGAVSGYASLGADSLVPQDQLGTGVQDGTKFLRDDGSWQAAGGAHPDLATHDALGLATDTELTTHAGAADPHTGYRLESVAIAAADVAADVATQAELDAHAAAADPHTGYRLESADHTHATTGLQAGQIAHSALTGLTTGDDHTQYQKESEKAAASGYASLGADSLVPQDQLGTGVQDGTKFLRDDGTWQAPTAAHPDLATHDTLGLATQSELDTHAGAADPHTGYVKESDANWIDLTDTGATTLHSHAGGSINTLRKTADQTINGGAGVFVDITGLTFSVVSGVDYAFDFYITFRSAATTTGWKAGVNCPAGTLDFWAGSDVIANGAAGVATHTERHNVTRDDMTLLTATITQAVDLNVRIRGRYLCTANGTFAARFANELANTDIVVQKGSWGMWF